MTYKRYKRKSSASSVISDVAYIGSKLSWLGALLLGLFSFTLFYFILPTWIASILQKQEASIFYPALEAIFARRFHWLEWLGITTGIVGVYFSIRNYHVANNAHWQERGLVSLLAKLFGKSVD